MRQNWCYLKQNLSTHISPHPSPFSAGITLMVPSNPTSNLSHWWAVEVTLIDSSRIHIRENPYNCSLTPGVVHANLKCLITLQVATKRSCCSKLWYLSGHTRQNPDTAGSLRHHLQEPSPTMRLSCCFGERIKCTNAPPAMKWLCYSIKQSNTIFRLTTWIGNMLMLRYCTEEVPARCLCKNSYLKEHFEAWA